MSPVDADNLVFLVTKLASVNWRFEFIAVDKCRVLHVFCTCDRVRYFIGYAHLLRVSGQPGNMPSYAPADMSSFYVSV